MHKRRIFSGLREQRSSLGWFLISLLLIAALVSVFRSLSPGEFAEAASYLFRGATPTPPSQPLVLTMAPPAPPLPTSEMDRLPVWASPTPLPPLSAGIPGQFSVQNITLGQAAQLNAELSAPLGDISWSPDGRMLAFGLATGGKKRGAEWPLTDVALIDASSRNVQRLVPGFNPTWSPSGNLIAYLDYSDSLDELYVRIVDIHTRQSTLVAALERGGVFPILAWLSDTELLYYQDTVILYNYRTDQKSKWFETVTPPFSIPSSFPFQCLATLPSQGLIATASGDTLIVWERGENGIRVLKQLEGVDNCALAFSPDGNALAYVSGPTQQIKIVPTRSDDRVVELPWASRGTAWSVSWSPDGASLVYVDADGVHMVNRDGSGLGRILQLPGVVRVVWPSRGGSLTLNMDSGVLLSLPVSVRQ